MSNLSVTVKQPIKLTINKVSAADMLQAIYDPNHHRADAFARANHTGTQLANTISDFSAAADARITLQKGAANGLATLGSDSKIPIGQLPALAISETFVVASQAAMLALPAQQGDVAKRTDTQDVYILNDTDPTVLGNWILLSSDFQAAVDSVNGRIGVVVGLAEDNAVVHKTGDTITPTSNSTTTIKITNADASKNIFMADTTNARVVFGNSGGDQREVISVGGEVALGSYFGNFRIRATNAAKALELRKQDDTGASVTIGFDTGNMATIGQITVGSNPTAALQVSTKQYSDAGDAAVTAAMSAAIVSATPPTSVSNLGLIQLAGDLKGTATNVLLKNVTKVYNAADYASNYVADAVKVLDGAITSGSPVFSSASTTFTAAMVGKSITIVGAAASGGTLRTTVLSFNAGQPHQVTLAVNAGTTVTGAESFWGTDVKNAINAAITAAGDNGGGIVELGIGPLYSSGRLNPRSYVTLRAGGMDATTIYGGASFDWLFYYTSVGTPLVRFKVQDMSIDIANMKAASVFTADNAAYCVLNRVRFKNVPAGGWFVKFGMPNADTTNLLAESNVAIDCEFDTHRGSLEMFLLYNQNNFRLIRPTFTNKVGGGPTVGLWQKCYNTMIVDPIWKDIEGGSLYYSLTTDNTTIVNPQLENAGGIGGANVSDNGTFGETYVRGLKIVNPQIVGGPLTMYGAGIQIGAVKNAWIINPQIDGMEIGIIIDGGNFALNTGSLNWNIVNPIIRNCNPENAIHVLHPGIAISNGADYGNILGGQIYDDQGNSMTDGVMTAASAQFDSATARFQPSHQGSAITVQGAGVAGAALTTTILTVVSSTRATLAAAASTTVSAAAATYGVKTMRYPIGVGGAYTYNHITIKNVRLSADTVNGGVSIVLHDGAVWGTNNIVADNMDFSGTNPGQVMITNMVQKTGDTMTGDLNIGTGGVTPKLQLGDSGYVRGNFGNVEFFSGFQSHQFKFFGPSSASSIVTIDNNSGLGTFKGGLISNAGGYVSGLAAPTGQAVANQGTAGSTAYTYKITAVSPTGESLVSGSATTATGNATLDVTNFNRVTWTTVVGATSFRVYRTASAGTPATTGLIGTVTAGGTLRLDDTGLAATTAAPTVDSSSYYGINTSAPTSELDLNGAQTVRGMTAPGVSASGQGRIYFDSTSHKFRVSEHAGAYADLYPGQSLAVGASPTFAGLTIGALSGVLKAAAGVIAGSATTTDLTEGSNLYYTTARANTDFDTRLATKSTANLTEGSNLYYTDARVRANRLDQMAAPTGSVSMNSQKITNLLDPSSAQDAATKNSQDVGDTAAKARANHTGTQVAATISDFSAAADARITAQKAAANGLATLDSGGLIPTNQLPALAITSTQVAASQAAQLALTTQEGDVVVRTDQNKSYIRLATSLGTMADYQELLTPTDTVLSVNGYTGAVTIVTTDVAEGTNLYYTNTRADARIAAAVGVSVQGYSASTTILGNSVVGSGSIVLATSPTIVTPTIASFANANHNHSNSAGGGQISLTVAVTGILPIANGGTGSATQNFVDISTTQTGIAGNKTFSGNIYIGTGGLTPNLTFGDSQAIRGNFGHGEWQLGFANKLFRFMGSDGSSGYHASVHNDQGWIAVGTSSSATTGLDIVGGAKLIGSLTVAVMSNPSQPTVANQGTAGSTSYTYTVVAVTATGNTAAATVRTTTTGNATLDATNFNRITWSKVNGSISYRIYRTASSGTPSSTGLIGTFDARTSLTLQFDDTGLAGDSATAPTTNTTGLSGFGVTSPTAYGHFAVGSAAAASVRIPTGVAPTSPNDGDMWNDGTHLFARINGATQQLDLNTLADATNIVVGTTTGTQFSTAANQKWATHGATPVIQRAGAAQAAVVTTAATNVTPYGYTTQAQADAIVTLLNEIRAAMVEKGFIKGSA